MAKRSKKSSGNSSKRSIQGKKFRKKAKIAEICLTNLAKALDECGKHNVQIKLRYGVVCSDYGYVLPRKHRWVIRMLIDSGHRFDDDGGEDLTLRLFYCKELCGCNSNR